MNTHRSWIEIDLDVFRNNIRLIKKAIEPKKFCLPIKSNAYGHGLIEIGKVAEEEKVDYLAVASVSEGVILRNEGIKLPILVLGAFQKEEIVDFLNYNLDLTISSLFKASLVNEVLKETNQIARVQLKVDTGMRRIGARPDTALTIYHEIKNSKKMQLTGVYSHLAIAEEKDHPFNQIQIDLFQHFLNKVDTSNLCIHLSNSSACINRNLAFENMVRPGLLTFGCNPNQNELIEGLRSFFTLKSKVSYFKVIEKGEGVSYGHTYISNRRTRIVTIPIGYGDGYLRALSNKGSVLIRGRKYPIVGAICMDQLMVDIQDGEAYVGDEVVLIGKQKNEEISILEVANQAMTIPYEILCHFNERLPRIYVSSSKTISVIESP